MSSTKLSKIPVQASISPAWRSKRPENGSSLPLTIMTLAGGCCASSSLEAARPDTPPGHTRAVSIRRRRSRRPRNGSPATINDAAIGERDGLLNLAPIGRAPLVPRRSPMGGTGGIGAARRQQGQIEQLQAAPRGIHDLHPLALRPGISRHDL